MQINTFKLNNLYANTGVAAIILGGLLAAGFAKTPSTLTMWTSAYLVLVLGVAQIFLAAVVADFTVARSHNFTLWIYSFFNLGSWMVIIGTVLKYSSSEPHMVLTILGAALIVGAMTVLGWQLRTSKGSRIKVTAYVVISVLTLSSPIGVGLAALR